MAMASEYLEVVLGDLYCCTYFRGVIEPETSCHAPSCWSKLKPQLDVFPPGMCMTKKSLKTTSAIEWTRPLDRSNSSITPMITTPFETCKVLPYPTSFESCKFRSRLVAPWWIPYCSKPLRWKRNIWLASCKILRMRVEVDLYVIDDDDTDGGYGTIGLLVIDYEPKSAVHWETGEDEGEVSSTVCLVCMEEIMVGSEATHMPCSRTSLPWWLHCRVAADRRVGFARCVNSACLLNTDE